MRTFLGALHSEKSFLGPCLLCISSSSSIHPSARQFQGFYLEVIYCVYIVLYIYEHSEANLNISRILHTRAICTLLGSVVCSLVLAGSTLYTLLPSVLVLVKLREATALNS
jgi:hypothetical protein